MGEIADLMLDGEMCQECGEFIEPALGYPGLCAGCSGRTRDREQAAKRSEKVGKRRRGRR